MNPMYLALIITLVSILTSYFVFACISLFTTGSFSKTWKQLKNFLLLEGYFVIVLKFMYMYLFFYFVFWLIKKYEYQTHSSFFLSSSLIFLILSAYLIFDYFISPLIVYARNNKEGNNDKEAEFFLKQIFNDVVPVYIMQGNIKNAYANGIVKIHKTILMGMSLKDGLSTISYNAILLHEYAHCRKNDILSIFVLRLLCIIVCAILQPIFFSFFDNKIIGVVLSATILTGPLGVFLPQLYQRRCEYKADAFAASIIGVQEYTTALRALNDITKGGVEKGSLNYPTLKQRIANVEKIKNKTAHT